MEAGFVIGALFGVFTIAALTLFAGGKDDDESIWRGNDDES